MKPSYRYDKGEIRSAHINEDGFLISDSIITRTGVFIYKNADGSLRRELRHPDDILKQDSIRTLKMLPITLMHPPEKKVDSMNASRLSKGFTGEDITIDGKFIRNKLKICDQEAINAVQGGMQELSLGYTVMLVEENGEYDGQNFDFRQTEVVYNHLAIVPSARAGNEARIVMDENDAIQVEDTTENNHQSQKTDKENRMKKINIDGIEYEAAPEVINKLTKEIARADSTTADLKTVTDEKSALQAKLDEANEKIKKHDSHDSATEIQTAVNARLALVAQATPHLDEDILKKVTDMTDKDIKVAVIKKHYPEAKLDEKDDVYIDARYDGAIELPAEKKDTSISSQRQTVNKANKNDTREEPDQEKSRNDMLSGLKDAWKIPESK